MTQAEILDKVSEILTELLEIESDAITLQSHLVDDLGMDSIDAIDMAARLQELTGKRISQERLQGILTVGDVINIIEDMTHETADQSD